MQNLLAWLASFLSLATPVDLDAINREAAVEAANVVAYAALLHDIPAPPTQADPPVAPDSIEGMIGGIREPIQHETIIEEFRGPITWTENALLGVIVRGVDMWLNKRGYSGEMDRVVHNAKRMNDALDAFAKKGENPAALVSPVDPRQLVKVVIRSKEFCDYCNWLKPAAFAELPRLNWKLATVQSIAQAINGEADFCFLKDKHGEEEFSNYPTAEVYVAGELKDTIDGRLTPAQLSQLWKKYYRP